MSLTSLPMLLAQVTADDLEREKIFLQHNYEFLSYGLTAAWVILVIYLLMLLGRQKKLKREIASLRAMLEDKKA
ncbi:MAG TPA: CcmD family protein [Bryobacteraceae bacterium]|nr:CcmD family protein [Bryobacteraceae bacterium]